MIIKKAETEDFEDLKELKKEFFLLECEMDTRLRKEWADSGLGIRIAKNLKQKNTAFFIAYDRGKAIGYAGVEIANNPSFMKERQHGHIFNLYVREEHRNKGVGKKLLKRAESWIRENKVKEIIIESYRSNKKATGIYERQGWKGYIDVMIKYGKKGSKRRTHQHTTKKLKY